jgi:hypothetical protein
MVDTKSILIVLKKEFAKHINDVMNHKLKGENVTYMSMHTGSKQQWYRELLDLGLQAKLKEYDERKREYEKIIHEDIK